MYTEQDRAEIRHRIKKYVSITVGMGLVWIAGYVLSMIFRWQIPAYAFGIITFITLCFGWIMFIRPCIRYNAFLRDMQSGLGRSMEGTVVEVSGDEDYQDGVRVFPVRILLKEEQDERIVYLNVSKRQQFPEPGTAVRVNCFGRHIKEVLIG